MTLKEWFKETFEKNFTLSNIRALLLEASSTYYNTEERIMTDLQYDQLRSFYERKSGEELPVGAKPVGNTLELSHTYSDFAGTLSKCKNIDDWESWVRNKGVTADPILASIKADGHSITVEFEVEDDKLVLAKALTRGDNGVGKDLTALFRLNGKSIPMPDIEEDCAVGYEAVITYDDFEKLTTETGGKYKNPRSAIGGIFSTKGQKYFKYITLVPIRIKCLNSDISRRQQLEILGGMRNFHLLQMTPLKNAANVKELYDKHERAKSAGEDLVGFMYDGLVLETLNEKRRKALGHTSTEPNYATALKFTPIEEATKVTSIEWSTEGHNARFTPVVHFEPVVIRGNTYRKVSLANYGRFKELGLKVGSPIVFTLRNDTLGYVDALKETVVVKGLPIQPPTHCPSCGEELKVNSVFLECIETDCTLNKVGNIYAFIEKVGIKNIGLETVRELFAYGVLESIKSLYNIKTDVIKGLDGFGETSANAIKREISKVFSSPIKDYIFIGSLNIPLIGRSRCKTILDVVTLDDLLTAADTSYKSFKQLLSGIPTVGEETITTLYNGIIANKRHINFYKEKVGFISTKVERSSDFEQLTFCHTGGATPLKDRNALKDLIEGRGHKLSGGVSKNTSYLINNDTESTTSKNAKAHELGVKIISVAELIKILK